MTSTHRFRATGLLALLVLGVLALRPSPAEAILNGRKVAEGHFPFVGTFDVKILNGEDKGKVGKCTTSLVNRNWAITAGHCLTWEKKERGRTVVGGLVEADDITLVFRRTRLSNPDDRTEPGASGLRRGVVEFHFDPSSQDIAMLRLSAPVDEVAPVALARPEDYRKWSAGKRATVVGWGVTTKRDRKTSVLRSAQHVVRDSAVGYDAGKIKTTPASHDSGRWAFHGDSGGPLLHQDAVTGQYMQIGVFSAFAGGDCVVKCTPMVNNRWGKVGRRAVANWIDDLVHEIYDGDFEDPEISGVFPMSAGDHIGAWKITDGSVDLTRDDYWQAASGAQSVDLNSCSPGRLARRVDVNANSQHTLSFWYAGNPDGQPTVKQFHLEIDGVNHGDFTFDTSSTSRSAMGWQEVSLGFVPTRASIEIAFVSDTPGCYGPVLDGVRLAPHGFATE